MPEIKHLHWQSEMQNLIKGSSEQGLNLVKNDEHKIKRIQIYRAGYFSKILASLKEDFSGVNLLIGEQRFAEIVKKYSEYSPSKFWTLAEYSADFPKFMHNYVADDCLYDLAQFEWFKIKCSLGSATKKMDISLLANLSEEQWLSARLQLVPSLKIFSSYWPVNEVEKLKLNKTKSTDIFYYALFRSNQGLQVLLLTNTEINLLEDISLGHSFGELVEKLQSLSVDTEQISAIIANWVQLGLIEKVLFQGGEYVGTQ